MEAGGCVCHVCDREGRPWERWAARDVCPACAQAYSPELDSYGARGFARHDAMLPAMRAAAAPPAKPGALARAARLVGALVVVVWLVATVHASTWYE